MFKLLQPRILSYLIQYLFKNTAYMNNNDKNLCKYDPVQMGVKNNYNFIVNLVIILLIKNSAPTKTQMILTIFISFCSM